MLINLMRTLVSRLTQRVNTAPAPLAGSAEVIQNLLLSAVALHRSGNLARAISIYEDILLKHPDTADALHLLAIVEHRRGNLDRAQELVDRAVNLVPHSVEYLNTFASVLSDLGKVERAMELLKQALRIDPTALRPRSNLLFMLNLLPGAVRKEIFDEHLLWAKIHCLPPESISMATPEGFRKKKLRIGYVSGDFRAHPVGRIMSAILPCHDKSSVEVFCYDNTRELDAVNESLRSHCDRWAQISAFSDEQVTDLIRHDGIDILIDLSGHTHGNRLLVFARKPAPIQASWLGYLNTTGMEQMDWRITCPATDPEPDASAFHSERIWSLPECLWPWLPDAVPHENQSVSMMASFTDNIVFGSFNTFRKINSQVIRTWAEIIKSVPTSTLRMHGVPRGRTMDDLLDIFRTCGADPAQIEFFGVMDHAKYQQAYSQVHIALDPFPYSGGATTCECLWMGVPVIAMGGSGGFARSAAGILSVVGLDELIAENRENYISCAIELSRDNRRLHEYRNSIRQRMKESPIMDARRFVNHLECAYQSMWDDQIRQFGAGVPAEEKTKRKYPRTLSNDDPS